MATLLDSIEATRAERTVTRSCDSDTDAWADATWGL